MALNLLTRAAPSRFRRALRHSVTLLELLAAAACVWAATYHTPVGAAFRALVRWGAGGKAVVPSFLSYYRRGNFETATVRASPPREWATLPPVAEVAPREALARGAWAVWDELAPARRRTAMDLARQHGASPERWTQERSGVEGLSGLLAALRPSLGSDDAGVLALFCGEAVAQYAAGRVRAAGQRPSMEELSRYVPPGYELELTDAFRALSLGTAYGLAWPVPAGTAITSPFGVRTHPTLGGARMHTGIDLGLPEGTPVRAADGAVVRRASQDAINGRIVVLDHGRGVTTAYCHNSLLMVSVGQKVERGQVIAKSGNTGRSTGPHLHYQLELGQRPVDPLQFR